MTPRSHLRDIIARLVLRGFDADEVDDVLRDLQELARDRGRAAGALYFWTELAKYPMRRALDRVGHPNEQPDGGGGGMDGPWMDGVWRDTRFALRSLTRHPGFSVVAVAILALGIGAATAIVSVVKGVLLDPLPYEEPDRVVSLWLEPVPATGGRSRMTPGNFTDIAALGGAFSSVASFGSRTASLSVDGEPVFLRGGAVTPAYFETLGVRLVAGRGFRSDEGALGGPPVVVLAHHVWQQMFGADPGVLGTTVELDGAPFEVIGVAPPGIYPTEATVSAELPFTTSNQDFFVPLRYGVEGWSNRRSHVLGMIGRLPTGGTLESTGAALAALGARLRRDEPLNAREGILMTPLSEEVVGDVRLALLTLLATVGLVLAIAITNLAALFALRAADRGPEIALRTALGAPRARLLRQLLLECALIVGAAAAAAVLVAERALELMRMAVPYQIPRLADVSIDGVSLATAIVLALGVAASLSVAPAARLARGQSPGRLGERGRTSGRAERRAQAAVVALQAGLAVIVIVGAALLTRSYDALRSVDTGFTAHDSWAMDVPADAATLEEVVRRVRELPGVAAAAVAYDHPLSRSWGDGFVVEGVALADGDPTPSGSLRPFGEGYFEAAGIEVVEGRVPGALEMAGPVAYAVINESLRDAYLGDRNAVGARIVLPTAQRMFGSDGVYEVFGVVRDVRFLGPDQPPGPALYVPLSHFPVGAQVLVVRPERAGVDVLAGVREIVRAVDPGLAVQSARRLGDILDDLVARPRFNMMLLVALGLVGLGLCGLGAYGLVGRVVAMRMREIGIRMALGEDRSTLARSVLGSALRPMLLGGAAGLVVSLAGGRLLRSLLFEVSPVDPVSLVAGPAFVVLAGAVAALVPTLRALAIDPAATLRGD